MPDIVISESITGTGIDGLVSSFDVAREPDAWNDPARLATLLSTSRALIIRNQTKVTAELLRAAPRLAVIGRMGVGLDNIDVRAASAAGVVVTFAPDGSSNSVAELVIGFMIALARGVAAADRDTRAGQWSRARFMNGVELAGKTLGLVGVGRIGFRTGLKARALGLDVVAHDPYADPQGMFVTELRAPLLSLDDLCARADFISCHVPENADTRGLFSYQRFLRCKPGAFFINTARGGVVDEDGLVRALDEGRLAGAALDVRRDEPPRARGPLEDRDNVILTPHIGAFTRAAQSRVVTAVCHDVAAVLRGGAARQFANFSQPRSAQERSAP